MGGGAGCSFPPRVPILSDAASFGNAVGITTGGNPAGNPLNRQKGAATPVSGAFLRVSGELRAEERPLPPPGGRRGEIHPPFVSGERCLLQGRLGNYSKKRLCILPRMVILQHRTLSLLQIRENERLSVTRQCFEA